MKRQRGRNRNHKNNNHNHNNHNRSLDSNGPDVKLRGTAATIYEKYTALARDAKTSGNRVKAENYRQHAEHYLRLVNIQEAAKQAAQQAREEAQAAREEAQAAREEAQAARQAARNDSDAPDDDASEKADNQDDNEGTARRQSKPRGRRKKADTVSTENDSDSGGSETNGSETSASKINASGTDEAQSDAKPIADTDSTPTELDVIAPSGTNLDANAHSDKPARRRKAPKKTPNKPENREPADILAMHEITTPDREINRDSEDANATLADGAIISDYQLKSEIIS